MKRLVKYKTLLRQALFLTPTLFIAVAFAPIRFFSDWQEVKSDVAAEELINLNKRVLKNESYSFTINYSSFKEYSDVKPYESQYGIAIRDGIHLYSKVLGAITIQNKQLRIVIDSAKHFIKITDPIKGQEPNFNINDYIKVIGICKSVKRKELDKIIAYRFEPKSSQGIVAQEIYLNDEFLVKSVIFYANRHDIRTGNEINSEMLYPKLEITISNFKKVQKINKTTFSTDEVLALTKNGIVLKGKYRSFKYFDGRVNK